jgi:peptidoglycan/xylan/chitin deacetylase (PgdA/CDA1 family)
MGTFDKTSPSYLSRGEYCAEVGVPRLLDVFERTGVRATWCVPTHTMLTFPRAFESILVADAHEVAAHGCWHEPVPQLSQSEEVRLMAKMFEDFERLVGHPARGYRSPAWDFTDQTMGILEEYGVDWDSSLMGRDFMPYHPRPVTIDRESGNTFGPPSPVLEFPVSWYLDDFPAVEFVPGAQPQLGSAPELFARLVETFDYAYENAPGGVLTLTFHPQTAGRPHLVAALERFLRYVGDHDGAWFATLSDIYDEWKEPGDSRAN